MSINLNNYGLGALAYYKFEETDDVGFHKRYNVDNNEQVLAVKKVKGKDDELITIDRKLITCWNKFKAISGNGPLGGCYYKLFDIGEFVTTKLIAAKKAEGERNSTGLRRSFHEISEGFGGEGSQAILENIYAIANRQKFSNVSFKSDELFEMVSDAVEIKPWSSNKGNLKKEDVIKHNPGMNARFLGVYLKNVFGANRSPEIRIDGNSGNRSAENTVIGSSSREGVFQMARQIKANTLISRTEISDVIAKF